MSLICCNPPPLFSFLLVTLTLRLLEAQTLIAPNSGQALFPFGSPAKTGGFITGCNRQGATFTVLNNCPYTIWPAAVPGGGKLLHSGQTWTLNIPAGTIGRVWGRTNCSFDSSDRGRCQTGDCNGLLQCQRYGEPPNTLAEFALNQFIHLDFYAISLVQGFNIPIKFGPTTAGRCSKHTISCAADIMGQCPAELRTTGGCNDPCTVFKTNEYCCSGSPSCGATEYSKVFKDLCPEAFSYPKDDPSVRLACPSHGTDYQVVFCP